MAKPCGFAIEFNPLGTPPLSLYSSPPPRAMALPTQVWTMGWRVPRAARGLGVEVVVWHTVPPLDGLMCCARCPHHGGPRLCCGVERAGAALSTPSHQQNAALSTPSHQPNAGALVQAAVRPGAVLRLLRARPSEACTHLCAEPEHVVGVWDGAGVGNPAGGASARRGLMAQSERLLRLVWAAVTESHTRWELLRL